MEPVRRRVARDVLLVAVTAAVCFAISAPFALGAFRQFTVWPGQSARFANMDWACFYFKPSQNGPSQISCSRESTTLGIHVFINGQEVEVVRFYGKLDKNGIASSFKKLLAVKRAP